MDVLAFAVDFVLHVDSHLAEFVALHGAWVYALLFAVIFVETGVVVMPFLPGDSLLFVVGALCGLGLIELRIVLPLLVAAAVAGDQLNYSIGRWFGPKVWHWEHSRWFNKRAFQQAHDFYEKYGGITIMLALCPALIVGQQLGFGVDAGPGDHWLPVRQPAVGQGPHEPDHLGDDHRAGAGRVGRRLARAAQGHAARGLRG